MPKILDLQKIHFIGIGGIGMSALARLFLHEGKTVSGSDREPSEITKVLEKEGIHFFPSQVAENIPKDVELVVYTEAMPRDQEEMMAAKKLGVRMMNYFEALGAVANQYYLIAVAGTHGKTTTTAMIIDVLEAAGLDPTAIVGSLRSKTGSNYRAGKSKYMVVEACEYRRDFLSLTPDMLIITNIEAEHLDYYKDLKDVQHAFKEFAGQVREDGCIVTNCGDENIRPILEGVTVEVIDYGKYVDPLLALKQPGLHNQMNVAAAKAAATHVGVTSSAINESLEEFAGTWRRFEYKGMTKGGAVVYDDYAHHPTEIRATIAGARELHPTSQLTVIFQPHLYSRTEELFDDFVDALKRADRIIVTHVYDARDTGKAGVSGEVLAAAVKKENPNTEYTDSFEDVVKEVQETTTRNDVVFVMGAGDITDVANMLVSS